MFYCPKCQNIFNISKDLVNDQVGQGNINYDELMSKLIKDTIDDNIKSIISSPSFSIENINKHPDFKKLHKNKKDEIHNIIIELMSGNLDLNKTPNDIVAYFSCKNCAYTEPITPGTKIYSKSSSYNITDYSNIKHSDILPYTRKYTCVNKDCVSHKDPAKKEAKFFRIHNTFKVKYICLACETIF